MLFGERWDGAERVGQLRAIEIRLPALLDDLRGNLRLPEIRSQKAQVDELWV